MKSARPRPMRGPVLALLLAAFVLAACGETQDDQGSASSGSGGSQHGRGRPEQPAQDGAELRLDAQAARQPVRGDRARRAAVEEMKGARARPARRTPGASQVPLINSTIQKQPDALAIAGNDPNAVAPALRNAAKRGITVVGFDSDVAADARKIFVNQASSEQIGGPGQDPRRADRREGRGRDPVRDGQRHEPEHVDQVHEGRAQELPGHEAREGRLRRRRRPEVLPGDPGPDPGVPEPEGHHLADHGRHLRRRPLPVHLPEEGQDRADRARFPNQMRKFVKDGTVEEFPLWVPTDVGYLAGHAAAAIVSGRSRARRARSSRPASSASGPSAPTARSCSARRRVQQGQHRRLRLLTESMTVTGPDFRGTGRPPGPRHARGSGSSGSASRPTGPSSTDCASASRATSGASRSASPSSARKSCPRARGHRTEGARGGRPFAARAGRPRALPRGHVRDLEPGAARAPGRQGAGRAARRSSRPRRSTTRHRHRRVARQLRRLLRAGDRRRVHARGHPLRHGRRNDRRRRARLGEDRRLGARRGRRPRAAPRPRSASSATPIRACSTCTPTSPPCTPRSARTSRCSRSTTSAARVAAVTDDEMAREDRRDRGDVRLRRPVVRPDRRADRARAAGLVRARGGRPRQARRRLRPPRADLLLPRARRQRGRAPRRGRDRRQLAAHRARHPDRGRGRPEDERRPAHPRPPRRGRLVHRVLRARLRGGLRADGPRRARAHRDRRGPARRCARSSSTTASAARACASRRRSATARSRSSAARRRRGPAEADRRRGRVGAGRDVPDRQHELAAASSAASPPTSSSAGAPRARRTTSPSASATSPPRCAASRRCSTSSTPRSADGARLLPAACPARPARRVQGAPPRRLAGDAGRAARRRAGATTRCSCATTACWSATSRPTTSQARSRAMEATDVNARWQAEMAAVLRVARRRAARHRARAARGGLPP